MSALSFLRDVFSHTAAPPLILMFFVLLVAHEERSIAWKMRVDSKPLLLLAALSPVVLFVQTNISRLNSKVKLSL